MLPYVKIASTLQEISRTPYGQKAGLTSQFLAGLPSEMLCPSIRLLMGDLWPSWESREMGIGPEAILKALTKVSDEDILRLREELGDIGIVAEAALRLKKQRPLSREPLETLSVYEKLRHISTLTGSDSKHRKEVILRGLFLEASPLEGKYIARTALRNMIAGIGPSTMISAISQTFDYDFEEVEKSITLCQRWEWLLTPL